MHQTICGETPKEIKSIVKDKKEIEFFKKASIDNYKNLREKRNCLYQSKKIIDDFALNYINTISGKKEHEVLKNLIRKEFDDCEKVYPFLGNIFLDYYFNDKKNTSCESFMMTQDKVLEFIKTLENNLNIQVGNYIFNRCSREYFINIEYWKSDYLAIIKNDNEIKLDIEYDQSFLAGRGNLTFKNYKYVIIDGMIESVGEIHHLLYAASENKLPYVIFCFGMSEEVKKTIMENNKRKITNIMPVSININESTINILSDIATLHNSDIVSALKGQTISQAVRKELKIGKQITFLKGAISIDKICNDHSLLIHRKNIQNKIANSENEINKKLLTERLKRLTIKSINIKVPDTLKSNIGFIRELDYILRMIKFMNRKFTTVKYSNKLYYVPIDCLKYVYEKSVSLKRIYENTEKLILLKKE